MNVGLLQYGTILNYSIPIVHWWKRHGSTVHCLSGWRRQQHLLVVSTAQCPTLIGHHSPGPVVMLTPSTSTVSCSHLGSQDAGWRPRVSVGMAGMVHGVGVMVLIGTMTPDTIKYKRRPIHYITSQLIVVCLLIKIKKHTSVCVFTHLFSGDIEPSEEVPLSRCMVCRWSGLNSLSRAIMFHSCRRFLALRTFFTSLCNVPSTQRRCS